MITDPVSGKVQVKYRSSQKCRGAEAGTDLFQNEQAIRRVLSTEQKLGDVGLLAQRLGFDLVLTLEPLDGAYNALDTKKP